MAVRAAYAITPIVAHRIQIIEQAAQAKQLPVHHSFNAPLFTGTMTIPGPQHDWHLMPLAEDPAWDHRHGFPMPQEVIAQLRRIEAANLGLDTLYIAHETPKVRGYLPGSVEHKSLLMPPVSPRAQARAQTMGNVAAKLLQAAFAPVLLAGVVGAGAVATAAIAAGALVGLDPIIFGLVTDPQHGLRPGTPAAWMYLCSWTWE